MLDMFVIARAVGREQQRQQRARQHEVTQVIDAQLHLEAILGQLMVDRHQPCVVDQQIQAALGPHQLVGQRVHRRQACEIQRHHLDHRARLVGDDPFDRALGLGRVSTSHQHPGPFRRQRDC